MNKFEKVSMYENIEFNLPCRKTENSAGYDFEVLKDTVLPAFEETMLNLFNFKDQNNAKLVDLQEMAYMTKVSGARPTLVPTGVKCKLDPGYYLELSVRSSSPLKYWIILANSVGIIDADYYNNPDNEGHIYFQVINLSPFPIQLHKGDIIGQGIIHKYEVTEDDVASGERKGGFGSTNG